MDRGWCGCAGCKNEGMMEHHKEHMSKEHLTEKKEWLEEKLKWVNAQLKKTSK